MVFQSILISHPSLADQWDEAKNSGLDVSKISAGSNRKVWWVCSLGHSWNSSVYSRARSQNTTCPYCKNQKILSGFNDLGTLSPEIAKQWHPTKNFPLTPQKVTLKSGKEVWWLCGNNHEWKTRVIERSRNGCPYCSGIKAVEGENDLLTLRPDLAEEWHPTKNGELSPSTIKPGSGKIVWWMCSKNHEWQTSPQKRTIRNYGCPYCSSRALVKGEADLASVKPYIAAQWHPTKNNGLLPSEVHANYNKSVWWRCDKNHEWHVSPNQRVNYNTGCPTCSAKKFISSDEQKIADYISGFNFVVEQSNRNAIGSEIDIYIPEKKIGVEFNGLYWHSDQVSPTRARKRHHDKWLAAKNAGIQLIQIWEDDWKRNPELVKNMLAHKLGVSAQRKVFARKTKVITLSTAQAQKFLVSNHIQGFASGTHYVGLAEAGDIEKLVSVLVLKQESNNTLNIIRYATSANVVGGFTKLLSYAKKTYQPDNFITFADHTVSDGGLYESNGFIADKELKPDYMYVVDGERKHKFGYRLKKFRDDPNLQHVEGMTERELAQLNDLPRIWDAGKTRYVKDV